jgi:hypothetical protein|tara:strand:+ start:8508 stop:8744 length:237 start_codon:yes stop_codon:yes gene_type:complete
MTKAEIVQELLDKGYINAEKAVVLLTNETHGGITYIPHQPNPYWPTSPDWSTGNPMTPVFTTTNTFETNLNKNKKDDE